MEVIRLGNLYGFTGGCYGYTVYDSNGLCPTLNCMSGGGRQPMFIEENDVEACAIRGRNSDIKHTQQQLEISGTPGISNCITSVQKDSLIIEKRRRIRKMTPKETWRAMGFSDEDFEKAETVNSNTQLYKQSGNSIVKQVLMAIFSQLDLPGVPKWNDLSAEDKYALLGD